MKITANNSAVQNDVKNQSKPASNGKSWHGIEMTRRKRWCMSM